jgi:uncharacterized membrane protein (UPF0127 family)
MLFSFDLVLIDKNFKVVGLREMVRPFKITRPDFHAESVIELPAHTIYRSRTKIGDQLVLEPYGEGIPLPAFARQTAESEAMVEVASL